MAQMKTALFAVALLCLAAAIPSAVAQSCATGYIRVCVTPLACACVLPGNGGGDPIIRDFAGNKYEFFGEPFSAYNLYSDSSHQVNMGLVPGFVEGHNGSYMGSFGFTFLDFRANVTLLADGDITVETWEELPVTATHANKHAVAASGESSFKKVGTKAGDTFTVATDPFREYHGRVVDIKTGTLEMNIWSIPAGTKDSLGVEQPAYLNFNLTLLSPPSGGEAEGIIGETLHAVLAAQEKRSKNLFAESVGTVPKAKKFDGKGLTNDYRVSGIFGTDFAFNRFGTRPAAKAVARRSMLANRYAALAFPIGATTA